MCSSSDGSWLRGALTGILKPQRAVPQAQNLLRRTGFITWNLRRPFFRGMPTGPEAFLELTGMSGQWPCARTHIKKGLVLYSSSWWDVRLILTSSQCWARPHYSQPCWSVHGSGWVCSSSAGSQSRCTLTGILEPQGSVPPGSKPPWMGWVYRQVPKAPLFMGMLMGAEVFLELPGVSVQQSCPWTHLKKGLVSHLSSWWDVWQILIFSQQSGVYALLSGRCWAGIHFGQPCWSVHWSGRVCPGSSSSQLRCALAGIIEPQGAILPGSYPLRRG